MGSYGCWGMLPPIRCYRSIPRTSTVWLRHLSMHRSQSLRFIWEYWNDPGFPVYTLNAVAFVQCYLWHLDLHSSLEQSALFQRCPHSMPGEARSFCGSISLCQWAGHSWLMFESVRAYSDRWPLLLRFLLSLSALDLVVLIVRPCFYFKSFNYFYDKTYVIEIDEKHQNMRIT